MTTTTTATRRDITATIDSLQRLTSILVVSLPGDLLITSKATLVLVTRTGGPKGNQVVLADHATGKRHTPSTVELFTILKGRSVTFRRPEAVAIPADPAIRLKAAQKALEAMKPRQKGIAALRHEIAQLEAVVA